MGKLKRKVYFCQQRCGQLVKMPVPFCGIFAYIPTFAPEVLARLPFSWMPFDERRHRQVLAKAMHAEETMNKLQHIGTYLLICTFGFLSQPFLALVANATRQFNAPAYRRRSGWPTRFRLRDRHVEDPLIAPAGSLGRLHDLGPIRRHHGRAKSLGRSRQSRGIRNR